MPSVVTAKLAKLLRSRIDRNARQRGRKMSRELGISHGWIQNCLKKFLHRKAFKYGRVVALFDPTRKHQYNKCLALKRVLADGNSRRALFVDETPVPYGVAVLRQKWASLGEGETISSCEKFPSSSTIASIDNSHGNSRFKWAQISTDFFRKRGVNECRLVPEDWSSWIIKVHSSAKLCGKKIWFSYGIRCQDTWRKKARKIEGQFSGHGPLERLPSHLSGNHATRYVTQSIVEREASATRFT